MTTDSTEGKPEPIPEEWIDRLFGCMSEFYGDRWDSQFKNADRLSLYKTIWRSGLYGLNYDQIRKTLLQYRAHAKMKPNDYPPIVQEFHQIAVKK